MHHVFKAGSDNSNDMKIKFYLYIKYLLQKYLKYLLYKIFVTLKPYILEVKWKVYFMSNLHVL